MTAQCEEPDCVHLTMTAFTDQVLFSQRLMLNQTNSRATSDSSSSTYVQHTNKFAFLPTKFSLIVITTVKERTCSRSGSPGKRWMSQSVAVRRNNHWQRAVMPETSYCISNFNFLLQPRQCREAESLRTTLEIYPGFRKPVSIFWHCCSHSVKGQSTKRR